MEIVLYLAFKTHQSIFAQVIRGYTVDALLTISKDKNEWIQVATGTIIRNKTIALWSKGSLLIRAVRLNITNIVDTLVLKSFTVYLCN
jgi:hypothetical protein